MEPLYQPKIIKSRTGEADATMSLVLSSSEMAALDQLSARKQMSKKALIRQALRLYSLLESKASEGKELVFRDVKTKELEQVIVVGCGWPGMD